MEADTLKKWLSTLERAQRLNNRASECVRRLCEDFDEIELLFPDEQPVDDINEGWALIDVLTEEEMSLIREIESLKRELKVDVYDPGIGIRGLTVKEEK